MSGTWGLDRDPVFVIERDLEDSLGSDRLWLRNQVDLLVGIGILIDSL